MYITLIYWPAATIQDNIQNTYVLVFLFARPSIKHAWDSNYITLLYWPAVTIQDNIQNTCTSISNSRVNLKTNSLRE